MPVLIPPTPDPHPALDVRCHLCGADPGVGCRNGAMWTFPHKQRLQDALYSLAPLVRRQRDILDQVRAVCDTAVDEEFFGHTEQARIPVTTIYRALGES